MTEFSIIVTTYNQEYEKIVLTLDSIINQKNSDEIEIVITDDGSRRDYLKELEAYLEEKGFKNYRTMKNEQNVGTVKNCLNGLQGASSDFAMILSTGDLLSQENVVSEMIEFIKSKEAVIASGGIKRYTFENNTITTGSFHLGDPAVLKKGKNEVLAQQLLHGTWLSGGSLFFRREEFIKWLKELSDSYQVRYCEDFTSVISVLNDNRLYPFEKQIIWYEWGVGISSSGSKSSVQRTYLDFERFLSGIHKRYPKNKTITKAYRKFSLKNAIVNHLYPLYSLIRKNFENVNEDEFEVLCKPHTKEENYLLRILT